MGPISPPLADGSLVGVPLPVNELPIQVAYSCVVIACEFYQPAEVVYAGPAPFLVAGATQVNFRVTLSPNDCIRQFLGVTSPSFSAFNYFWVYVASQ